MVCSHISCFIWCFLSEELLGMHETVQMYSKFKLTVPLRLLHINSLKHRLTRDVSQFKLPLSSQPTALIIYPERVACPQVLKQPFHTHLCLAPS